VEQEVEGTGGRGTTHDLNLQLDLGLQHLKHNQWCSGGSST
jgi:hypothetical protein